MTHQKDQITIQKVIAGDIHAFAMLVNSYKDMAVILAYNILQNQEDAEEIAQDAFVKAYASLSTFKANARFSTWLYRIIVNTALNKRKLKKHDSIEISDALVSERFSSTNNVLDTEITGEHKKHIQFALQSLVIKERLCITLYYLNELSVEEIHELTDITISYIKVLLYRGRKNLYSNLNKRLKSEITTLI